MPQSSIGVLTFALTPVLAAQAQFAHSAGWVAPPAAYFDAAVGDLDGDGDRDFIQARQGARIEVWLNDGYGTFTDVTTSNAPATTHATNAIAVGDVDGDGDLDLVLAGSEPARLLLNDGTARFADVSSAQMPQDQSDALDIDFADFDADGDLDILLAERGPNRLLRNDGTGIFTDASSSLPTDAAWTSSAAIGDINGDGLVDIVCGNTASFAAAGWIRHNDSVWINDPSNAGSFVDVTSNSLFAPFEWTADMELADVDGDGDLDLVTANQPTTISGARTGGRNRLFSNDGTGVFTELTATHMPNQFDHSSDLEFADLDGDGDVDLLIANGLFPVAEPGRFYANDSTGRFTDLSAQRLPASVTTGADVELADFDSDGDCDVLLSHGLGFGGPSGVLINRQRQLDATQIAASGGPLTYTVFAEPGFAPRNRNAVIAFSPAAASIPVQPFGVLGLQPGVTVVIGTASLPSPDGVAARSVTLPPAGVTLIGATFYAQALIADSTGFAVLTNVATQTVVP